MKLQSLYKVDINGNMLGWRTWTEDNEVFTRHGRLDGQMQEDSYIVYDGTNIGKSNERDEFEQADFEAEAKWKRQVKYRGYFESQKEALNSGENTSFGALKPMKAQRWKDQKHKLCYPLFLQPKLNGLRCIAVSDETNHVRLFRSGGKEIKHFKHIQCELHQLMGPNEILDGELYEHGTPLSVISGIVRAEVNVKDESVLKTIKFYIFDAPKISAYGLDKTFAIRYEQLHMMYEDYSPFKYLSLVRNEFCRNEEIAELTYKRYVKRGYEGCMYRMINMRYLPGKRSYEIQKRKDFMDEEFKIVGANQGKGRAGGMAISFTCKRFANEMGHDVTFEVPMNGPTKYLRKLWNNEYMWIGKWLQTRFLNYTLYGKPEIPKGLQIRDRVGED